MEPNETVILYDKNNEPFALKATGSEARHIVSLLNAESKGVLPWNRLKDSTPNDNQQCLTLSYDGRLEVASYNAEHNYFTRYHGNLTIYSVVYWTPIPTPPDIFSDDL